LRYSVKVVFFGVGILLAMAKPALAQAAPCTYERCALRIKKSAFKSRIVAGIDGRVVAKLGDFGTDLEHRVDLPDSAFSHVQRYNSQAKLSAWLGLAGTVVLVTPLLVTIDDPGPGWLAAPVIGLGLSIASATIRTRAGDHLSQAIWWYNGQFAR
jgi:hypothetical protein